MKNALLACLLAGSLAAQTSSPSFDKSVQPFLARNCYACHNSKVKTADVDLQQFKTADSIAKESDVWEKAIQKMRTGEMPPKGFPPPRSADVKSVTDWLHQELERAERQVAPDPGRVTARRLNRAEYNNTIRDLLGVDLRPADEFPQDDSGYGFDNIGDVLSLSPVLMEKYMAAAEKVVRAALSGPEQLKPTVARYQPNYRDYPLSPKPKFDYDATGLSMPNALHATHRFPVDGEYVFNVVPEGRRPHGSEPVEMAFWLDGKQVKVLEVDAPSDGSSLDLFGQARSFRLFVPAGDHWIAGSVLHLFEGLPPSYGGPNPSKRPIPRERPFRPRPGLTPQQIEEIRVLRQVPANRVYIHYVEITGPYKQAKGPSPESLRKVLTCGHLNGKHLATCERKIIGDMARRAFRRPVSQSELQPYLKLAALAKQQGATSFEERIGVAIEGLLVSPDFLFRVEKSETPQISQHELASRLSYFLWSSMPDSELMRAANTGTLRKPQVLRAQISRMLKDPKALALVENFGGQWLETRRLESVAPDREKFPEFEEYLRMSMRKETDLLFENIIKEDRSILEFIDANYSFLNQRLAEFYGIPNVKGAEFRKVDLTGTPRGGILTQASVLTVSSYANRTSPVLRGKWVLENILNAPPPPPPPNVPALDEKATGSSASMRQQMEEHRKNATCASCHSRMDPLGFGLENFNAIGAWRTQDGKFPIDASGQLPDGRKFDGAAALKTILRQDHQAFGQGLTEKMLTYALGRGLERYDKRTVKQIASKIEASDYKFSSLVWEIVNSLPFQMRRVEKRQS
jgi:mono/diheme cytochrome c family protein